MARFANSVVVMTTAPRPRTPLLSRALLLRFVSVVGSSIGFFLPLSVVPMFADQAGAGGAAGLATGALLLTTVACELVTPRLVALAGYRWALGIGLVLLGAPALVLTVADSMWVIVAVSVVRGAGFAISVVAGGAITAMLIPPDRRGEGLGLVGLVGGVPGMLSLPAGVWAAAHWGYEPVFVVTAVASLLGLLSLPGVPKKGPVKAAHGVVTGLRNPMLMRPATLFAVSAAAAGVIITFLPLATSAQPVWVASSALLAQPAASTVCRWLAGRLGDRHGARRLLVPGLVVCVVGMAVIAATGTPAAVIGGALVFGAGFGVLQNASQALMYERVPVGGEGAVSAIWNAAYDMGMAAGALAVGPVIASIGYPATFLLTAVVMLPALALLRSPSRIHPRHEELPAPVKALAPTS
jgi:MFS family permease